MVRVRDGGLSHRENQAMNHVSWMMSPAGMEDKRLKGRGATAGKDQNAPCMLSDGAQFSSQGAWGVRTGIGKCLGLPFLFSWKSL